MNVFISKDGTLNLEDLFTKKQAAKIYKYSVHKSLDNTTIKIYFYDQLGNEILPALRKRARVKKAT